MLAEVAAVAAEDGTTLQSRLDDHRIGSTVRLTVLRDGRNTDVNVTLQPGRQ